MLLRHAHATGKPFFGCSRFPRCRGTHGAHPDGRPLGEPADMPTRWARREAHEAFDVLWRCGYVSSRDNAYAWLCRAMGKTRDEAHIARFSLEECERLLGLLTAFFAAPLDWERWSA